MKISASQAAKLTGKSVPTITRAIKKGKLSADAVEGGGWLIDPAELERVFTVLPDDERGNDTAEKPDTLRSETPEKGNRYGLLEAELKALQQRFDDFREMSERERRQLEQDRDRWHDQAKTASLTIRAIEDRRSQAEKQAAERPRLFAGLFGRKSA